MLPYVLPCKFCRASLSEYILEDPIDDACASPEKIQRWLWRIHNKVTAKLRAAHLTRAEDPPFSAVAKMYNEKLEQGCSRTVFDGWEFLFSVAENHPLSRSGRSSVPLPGAPPTEQLDTPLLRNRWNVMEPEERMEFYLDFWEALPHVLPFPEWRRGWMAYTRGQWDSRKDALATLWKIRSSLEKELDLLNRTDFSSLCKILQNVRSGCSVSSRSKTCRRKRANK